MKAESLIITFGVVISTHTGQWKTPCDTNLIKFPLLLFFIQLLQRVCLHVFLSKTY